MFFEIFADVRFVLTLLNLVFKPGPVP